MGGKLLVEKTLLAEKTALKLATKHLH